MKTSALLRSEIEASLLKRIPAALSPRERTEPARIACGVDPIDALLQGGLPVGVMTELAGEECSGRTTVALALLASAALRESVCAWIDVSDSFDPESAAANGVDLRRLLWVRCTAQTQSIALSPVQPTGGSICVPSSEPPPIRPAQGGSRGGGGLHPRSEGVGMPEAISAMLRAQGGVGNAQKRREAKSIGTPGMPNRPLTVRPQEREEQVASDRLPARRGEQVVSARSAEVSRKPRRLTAIRRQGEQTSTLHPLVKSGTPPAKRSWDALDQALRTADLLLQGGGFSVIVLDLGSTSPEMAWRIPLATWFRFRAACERTRVSFLLLTQHPCARSSAGLVVRMAAGTMVAENKVMTGIAFHAQRERQRFQNEGANVVSIRKPPQSERGYGAQWTGAAAWTNRR